MKVTQFGSFYFDPKDVVAIETEPLAPAGGKQGKPDYCHVYIKNIAKPVLFTGEAAKEICLSFIEEKETSLEGDKE